MTSNVLIYEDFFPPFRCMLLLAEGRPDFANMNIWDEIFLNLKWPKKWIIIRGITNQMGNRVWCMEAGMTSGYCCATRTNVQLWQQLLSFFCAPPSTSQCPGLLPYSTYHFTLMDHFIISSSEITYVHIFSPKWLIYFLESKSRTINA